MDFSRKAVWPGSTQLAPVPVVLAGVGDGGEAPWNLITIAWTGIVNSTPPVISLSIRPERYSYGLLKETGEFTVNVPTAAMAPLVDLCGVISGRDRDKFAETGLTPAAGSRVKAPVLVECPLVLECRVIRALPLGSHELFLGEVVAVQAAECLIDDTGRFNLDEAGLLGYGHGHYYELGRCIGHFGYSVRRKAGPVVRRRNG